jgi:hypothetical protein
MRQCDLLCQNCLEEQKFIEVIKLVRFSNRHGFGIFSFEMPPFSINCTEAFILNWGSEYWTSLASCLTIQKKVRFLNGISFQKVFDFHSLDFTS